MQRREHNAIVFLEKMETIIDLHSHNDSLKKQIMTGILLVLYHRYHSDHQLLFSMDTCFSSGLLLLTRIV